MQQDRFDQFYMLQTRAKDLEKKKQANEALDLYIEIIEHYFPDTDFSFSRAVSLLRDKGDNEKAIAYCKLAIERINAKDMKGDYTFFNAILQELEQKEKNNKKSFPIHKYINRKTLIGALYIVIALMLSFPFKIYKFAFIILIAISLLLLLEIIKRVRKNLKVTMQTVALLVAGALTIGSAAMIPRPEWTSFFSLKPLSQVANSGVLDVPSGTVVGEEKNAQSTTLTKDDLATLQSVYNDDLIIDAYEIWFEGDVVFLTIFAKNSASDDEIKSEASRILKELNAIKGMKSYDDRLGDLYKQYDAKVAVYDEAGNPKFTGVTSRYTLKIKW